MDINLYKIFSTRIYNTYFMDISDRTSKKIQILRALAVISVIFIHTMPIGIEKIFLRPFFNFAVAMFTFLSGLLTSIEIINITKFYQKRITRVLIPYIIWTLIYSISYWICGHPTDTLLHKVFFNLFTAKAAVPLYYIFVYMQLVLITPLLKPLITSKYKYLGLFVSPIASILMLYIPCLAFHHQPNWIAHPCFIWFSFYYLGLLISNDKIELKFSSIKWYYYIGLLCLQIFEGLFIYKLGGNTSSITQLKITSLLTSTYACLLGYKYIIQSNYINNLTNKVLINIGNYSFGIYLTHILVLSSLHTFHILRYNALHFPFYSICIFLITYLLVLILSKICGNKLSKLLGFI